MVINFFQLLDESFQTISIYVHQNISTNMILAVAGKYKNLFTETNFKQEKEKEIQNIMMQLGITKFADFRIRYKSELKFYRYETKEVETIKFKLNFKALDTCK